MLRMSGVTKYKRPSEMWGKRSKDATVYFVPTDSALFFDSERLRPIAVITRQGEAPTRPKVATCIAVRAPSLDVLSSSDCSHFLISRGTFHVC